MTIEGIRAVSFDLDGTLYRAKPVRRKFAWENLRGMRAIRVRQAVRAELRGQEFDDGAGFFAAEMRMCAERLEVDVDVAKAKLDNLFGPRFNSVLKRIGPNNDARATLQALVDAGIKIAVVSDYAARDKLVALGLDDLAFTATIAADECGALKPHPRAFEAARVAFDVEPHEILHVGDRADTDVEGAQRAGQQTLLLTSRATSPQEISTLNEILGHVLCVNGSEVK